MMLAKFSVKHYRGFSERIEWVLATPNNYEFNTEVIKDGIIKNGIIYGPVSYTHLDVYKRQFPKRAVADAFGVLHYLIVVLLTHDLIQHGLWH